MGKYSAHDERIVQLHSEGLTNRGIAVELDIPHWHAGKLLRSEGLTHNGTKRGVRLVDGENSLCSICQRWKPTTEFSRIRNSQYLLTYCNACRKVRSDANINSSYRKYLSTRFQRIKDRATWRGLDFDLTKDYLYRLYEVQEGRCFYTDEVMVLRAGEGRSRNGLSLDRVDPSGGYTQDNVVYCTVRVNSAKTDFALNELKIWMPEWHRRIENRSSILGDL